MSIPQTRAALATHTRTCVPCMVNMQVDVCLVPHTCWHTLPHVSTHIAFAVTCAVQVLKEDSQRQRLQTDKFQQLLKVGAAAPYSMALRRSCAAVRPAHTALPTSHTHMRLRKGQRLHAAKGHPQCCRSLRRRLAHVLKHDHTHNHTHNRTFRSALMTSSRKHARCWSTTRPWCKRTSC